eukprot:274366-Heterocapsa_arctica.AAC.1
MTWCVYVCERPKAGCSEGKPLQQHTCVYAVPLYGHVAPHGAAPNTHMRAEDLNGSDRDCLPACPKDAA